MTVGMHVHTDCLSGGWPRSRYTSHPEYTKRNIAIDFAVAVECVLMRIRSLSCKPLAHPTIATNGAGVSIVQGPPLSRRRPLGRCVAFVHVFISVLALLEEVSVEDLGVRISIKQILEAFCPSGQFCFCFLELLAIQAWCVMLLARKD